jgi:type III restriction enzyme
MFDIGEVHINIFNISKINSEVRVGNTPRIKRLSEYIGESYFDYLAGLDDLVLLMDESHRYRAEKGMRAINELNPILGLELTATPQIQEVKTSIPFQNVIYSYPLANAIRDGFVKEPAVATRENFNPAGYDEASLERLKLEDGVRLHENSKVELEIYAREQHLPIVKPFMLVVAQDTDHAGALVRLLEADDFFDGRYRGRVITVHSNQRGQEKDETVEKLLSVEDRLNPVEIVVHVNMLKEGWDVTNLYTIVPLRTANSKTLVEQSIGRGLRLPYGKRTDAPAVDRLTIVSHDRFQEIIDAANSLDSIIRTGVVIGKDIPAEGQKIIAVPSTLVQRLIGGNGNSTGAVAQANAPNVAVGQLTPSPTPIFYTPREQRAVHLIMEVIKNDYETLPRAADLCQGAVQEAITTKVYEALTPAQLPIDNVIEERLAHDRVAAIVAQTTAVVAQMTINIPRITVVPKGEASGGFRPFALDLGMVRYQPVAQNILVQHLQSNAQYRLHNDNGSAMEAVPANYLIRSLMEYNDINYDDHADLLYRLANQVVEHLRTYLADEAAVLNVLQYHEKRLAELVHLQMQEHYEEYATAYEAYASHGFTILDGAQFSIPPDQTARNFRQPVVAKHEIRTMIFEGFQRCLLPQLKFDSDAERRLAIVLENDPDTNLKWLKPPRGSFRIYYQNDRAYEPDFVVETTTTKYICEPKRADEMEKKEVVAKANAALLWCQHASDHAAQHSDKPWRYLLIPHDAILENMTLAGLAARYTIHRKMVI